MRGAQELLARKRAKALEEAASRRQDQCITAMPLCTPPSGAIAETWRLPDQSIKGAETTD